MYEDWEGAVFAREYGALNEAGTTYVNTINRVKVCHSLPLLQ